MTRAIEKHFGLKRPCAQCPFKIEPHFYLGKGRRREIADSITKMGAQFPCHKTTHHDDETGDYTPDLDHEVQCAGAIGIMAISGEVSRYAGFAIYMGIIELSEYETEGLPVSFDDWVERERIQ